MVSHKRTLSQCPRTRKTVTHSIKAPPSPSHLAHTAQLGRLEKEIHRQRDIIAQSRCTPAAVSSITTNPVNPKTLAVSSLPPSLHQWKAVRSWQPVQRGPRTFSIFSLIQSLSRDDHNVSPRVDSTSGQHPKHPHASQVATSPTELSRHLSAFTSRT